MKNRNYLFIAVLIAVVATSIQSCKTIKYQRAEASVIPFTKLPVYTRAKIADIKIETTKVVASVSGYVKEKKIDDLKAEAVLKALRTTTVPADIIIEPIYEIERDDKLITVRVTGFPAKVISFKDIAPEDAQMFSIVQVEQTTSSSSGNATSLVPSSFPLAGLINLFKKK